MHSKSTAAGHLARAAAAEYALPRRPNKSNLNASLLRELQELRMLSTEVDVDFNDYSSMLFMRLGRPMCSASTAAQRIRR